MYDPRRTTLRFRLDSGETLAALWLSLGSPAIAEMAGRARPGVVVIDQQHGLWDRPSLEAAIGLVPPDVPVMVRVGELTPLAISAALDAGAEGVIVPLVETAVQARRAVRLARFPGAGGVRSGGGVRPLADFPGYFERADRVVVAVMIETERGVRNAHKIARAQGLDMVFIGTSDLAISLRSFPAFDARVLKACARIHRACAKAYLPCGIFTPGPDMAVLRNNHGYRMVVVGNDIDLIGRGMADAVKVFRRRRGARPEPGRDGGLPTL